MAMGAKTDFDGAIAAAMAWWRDAGVENAFVDAPTTWLQPERSEGHDRPKPPSLLRKAPPPEPTAPAAPPPLPETLDQFREWWLSTPDLDGGRVAGRVAPRGEQAPRLMIVTPHPESADRERLLSGPEGRLLEAFQTACGLDGAHVYHASALPCHSPGSDWSSESTTAVGRALRHHIALVRPERLLVLGFVILPLLGHASPQGPAVSLSFNHEGATVPMLAVRRLPAAASLPRWKSALWRAWLEWTGA